jgi:hypothetical protein
MFSGFRGGLMPNTAMLTVKALNLDLANFRTTKQKTEIDAMRALIDIDPDWFWALMRSLLTDGYLPTENIVVLRVGGKNVVKEGNRRVAALKIILNQYPKVDFDLPEDVADQISQLPTSWKTQNKSVPCAVYAAKDADGADRVVAMTHGKAEKAGRSTWKSIARARHARDTQGAFEPALDLVEKYLDKGQNLTPTWRAKWAGNYGLTTLDEALQKLVHRTKYASPQEIAAAYPTDKAMRGNLEVILRDIGLEDLTFAKLRDTSTDYLTKYGFPKPAPPTPAAAPPTAQTPAPAAPPSAGQPGKGSTAAPSPSPTPPSSQPVPPPPPAVPLNSPAAVLKTLKSFNPHGSNRAKVATLVLEMRDLRLAKTPLSFCFATRSLLELSAKAYCDDHAGKPGAPVATDSKGVDKTLLTLLQDCAKHMGAYVPKTAINKELHGALVELAQPQAVFSVVSLNQLIHNPKFAITEQQIATSFHNIFPLLDHLNK